MIDLVGGEGDGSMGGLWGGMNGMASRGNGSCGKGGRDLRDIGKSTVYDGGVAVCQLTTGVTCEENVGGK